MWVFAQIFENILLGSLHSTWYVLNIVQYILIHGLNGEVSFDTWLLSNKINNDENNSIEGEGEDEGEEDEDEDEEDEGEEDEGEDENAEGDGEDENAEGEGDGEDENAEGDGEGEDEEGECEGEDENDKNKVSSFSFLLHDE